MAISLVGVGTPQSGKGVITVSMPGGIQANDIAFLLAATASGDALPSPPSGFSQVTGSPLPDGGGGMDLHLYRKVLTGTETSYNLGDSGPNNNGVLVVWRGVDTTNPINVSTTYTTTSGTAHNGGTITTSVASAVLVAFLVSNGTGANMYQSGGWASGSVTSEVEQLDYVGDSTNLGIYTGLRATAGTSGNFSFTKGSAVATAMIALALKPAPTALSIPVTATSYTTARSSVGLRVAKKAVASAASYSLSVADVVLSKSIVATYNLAVTPKAYTLTPTASIPAFGYKLLVSATSYAFTQVAAELRYGGFIMGETADFTIGAHSVGLDYYALWRFTPDDPAASFGFVKDSAPAAWAFTADIRI